MTSDLPSPDGPAADGPAADGPGERDVVEEPGSADSVLRRRAAERRRLAEVFGDVLPDATRDDVDDPDPAEGEHSTAARDAALLRDVPPHHTP
jgi:hypothetical protein